MRYCRPQELFYNNNVSSYSTHSLGQVRKASSHHCLLVNHQLQTEAIVKINNNRKQEKKKMHV